MSREGVTARWISLLNDYGASGESVVAWCKRREVTPRQFYYWRRKLKNAEQQMPPTSGSRWVALSVAETTTAEARPIQVRVGAATIEVRAGFEPALLVDVVRALKSLC